MIYMVNNIIVKDAIIYLDIVFIGYNYIINKSINQFFYVFSLR